MNDELDALREQHKNSPTSLAAKQALINGLEAALAAKDAEIASLERECAVRNERELGYLSRAQNAEAEAAGLRADAERWRAVSAMMTHEHRGDAVGWTLSVLLPGDDPDAAIDAARAGGE